MFSKAKSGEMFNAVEKSLSNKQNSLSRVIDLDEVAIDSAPFQLVLGSSLYKVHTLFSLLGLSHAYVTDCGRLVGVIALKELRNALANIYIRGAVPVKVDRKLTSSGYFVPKLFKDSLLRQEEEFDNLN
ncbi:unnamed protein product [Dracunculus medinensis]|uniref:CBS domain-containing protein n=1 Tax=Dracunculus medinensis TaxID=318479 RepID=A0A3P7T0Y9_DRAME|nr:unnamed protein product [Dracunculus medinensis]